MAEPGPSASGEGPGFLMPVDRGGRQYNEKIKRKVIKQPKPIDKNQEDRKKQTEQKDETSLKKKESKENVVIAITFLVFIAIIAALFFFIQNEGHT